MPDLFDRPKAWDTIESSDLRLYGLSTRGHPSFRDVNTEDYGGEYVDLATTRIVFTAVSLLCTFLLAAMFGKSWILRFACH